MKCVTKNYPFFYLSLRTFLKNYRHRHHGLSEVLHSYSQKISFSFVLFNIIICFNKLFLLLNTFSNKLFPDFPGSAYRRIFSNKFVLCVVCFCFFQVLQIIFRYIFSFTFYKLWTSTVVAAIVHLCVLLYTLRALRICQHAFWIVAAIFEGSFSRVV